MKAVMLDADSLGHDIDLAPIRAQVDDLVVWPVTAPEQVVERLEDADIALINKVVIDADAMAALPRLSLIAVMATGLNNVDSEAAAQHGVRVCNVIAYGTQSVAQHTLMMMLALATRLPCYQHDVAEGRWNQAPFFCLMDHPVMQLDGKHLVIVGGGELGTRVLRLAESLGMRVTVAARPGNEASDTRPPLEALAGEADVLSLHCPLTPRTHHLVDDALLTQLPSHALLINCARGSIIDEQAALRALQQGRLGGLGVDVLPEEPPRQGHVLIDALRDQRLNLIVTPHSAWISPEARQTIVNQTADNIARFFAD